MHLGVGRNVKQNPFANAKPYMTIVFKNFELKIELRIHVYNFIATLKWFYIYLHKSEDQDWETEFVKLLHEPF